LIAKTTLPALPSAIAGTAYSQQLSYTGGSGSPAWSLTTGALPPGLTLSAAGVISGTPSNAGAGATYTFTVTVTTGTQTSASVQFSIVEPALPAIATLTLPSGNVGIAYSQQLAYSGGSGATPSWAIVAGSLPSGSGLTLSTSGLLSGTPIAATTYNFSVAVTIGSQTSAPQAYTLIINSLVVTSGASASGEVALPFSFHLTAAGGTGPYTWSLAPGSNALPSGLALNASTGLISGTPTTSTGSPFSMTVQAADSLSATATQAMTITTNAARGTADNSELNGQYAFLLTGFDPSGNPLTTAGKFTADGNGNIVSGVLDTNSNGLTAPHTNQTLLAATYAVGSDNRGKLTLTTASGSTIYVLALNSISSGIAAGGTISEFDATGQTSTGVLALQTPSAFTTASITGGFAFGLHGFAANSTAATLTHRGLIGEAQFNGTGGINSAEYLSSASASTMPTIPTSATIAIAANGRGTLAITRPNGGGVANFAVYVVSTSRLFLVSSDPASGTTGTNDLLSGEARQQTTLNGNFTAVTLSGSSVVHTEQLGATSSGVPFANVQLGLFTFSGAGKISLSNDANAGGLATTNSLSGSYTVASNGRVSLTLSPAVIGGCADCVSLQTYFYLVGVNQGFVMDFSTGATTGYFEPQTATSFSAASLSGAYTIGSVEPLSASATAASGVLVSSGAGLVTETIDLSAAGTLAPDTALTGSYTIGSTGRAPVTLSGSSPIVYVVSATKALALDVSSTSPVIEEVVHQ
jgi:hypothetical protein